MDPVTAALNFATAAIALIQDVWKATPPAQQALIAGDIAATLHDISSFVLGEQIKAVKA